MDYCHAQTRAPLDDTHDEAYETRVAEKKAERSETNQVRKAVRDLGDVLYKKHGMVIRLLKEMQHITHEDYVTSEQIMKALETVGHPFRLEDVQRVILYLQPDADLEAIDYRKLFQDAVTSFHDVSASR